MENPEGQKQEQVEIYERAFEDMMSKGVSEFVNLEGVENVSGFLKYLVEQKGYLLHGSNKVDISELEPRQANCKSKKFGNRRGVYAVEDETLPIFYAIQDAAKARSEGVDGFTTRSGFYESGDKKEYHFEVTEDFLKAQAWSDGAIYILPRQSFEQGTDDGGQVIDEWLSEDPVVPVGKIKVGTKDFPYFEEIKPIE